MIQKSDVAASWLSNRYHSLHTEKPAGSSSVPAFSKTVFESHRFCGFYINPRNLCCDQIESGSCFSVLISCVVWCWFYFFFGAGFWGFNKELDTSEVRTPNPSPYLFAQMFLLRCQPPALEEGFCTNIHRELRSNKSLGKFGIYMWCAQCRVVRSANPSWQALGFQLEGSQRTKSKKTSYLLMNCVVWCSRCADFRVSTRVCI